MVPDHQIPGPSNHVDIQPGPSQVAQVAFDIQQPGPSSCPDPQQGRSQVVAVDFHQLFQDLNFLLQMNPSDQADSGKPSLQQLSSIRMPRANPAVVQLNQHTIRAAALEANKRISGTLVELISGTPTEKTGFRLFRIQNLARNRPEEMEEDVDDHSLSHLHLQSRNLLPGEGL